MGLTIYGLGQSICRLFHSVTQCLFTPSETGLDYYHQKVSVQVAHEFPNDLNLRILRN